MSAFMKLLVQLRKLLTEMCVRPYSSDITEFAPIVRVDGSIQQFGFRGLKNLRRSKKDRYITIEVGISQSDWQSKNNREIKAILFGLLRSAFEAFAERLKKDNVAFDEKSLLSDLEEVQRFYLEV